jgi:hypothetical protein
MSKISLNSFATKFSQHVGKPHHISSLKNIFENSRKMYYNPLRVIDEEFS